jgi:effector-binding domain-containing protein
MLDTPQIVQTQEQQTAVIRFTIPREQIQAVMGPGIGELMETLAAQGVQPAGPVFSHHFRMDPETFDFEIGVPVASPITEAGRVKPGSLPATTVARTIYHGGYEGLASAWGEFDLWVEQQGLTPAESLWESYAAGPESSHDPAAWRTELNRPLLNAG